MTTLLHVNNISKRFGPVHANSEIVNGKRRMHYRVEGLSVAGGDISGSLSSHSAEVFLRWASN